MSETSHSPRQFQGVMVSSTFTDLVEHRTALMEALRKEKLHPVGMEDYVAVPGDDEISSSLNMVRDSAAYIGLISHRYGQIIECPQRNPNGYSVTRLEFEEAQRIERPTLVFVMGENHPGTKKDFDTDPEKLQKLEEFRQYAKKGRIYIPFEDKDDFKRQVGHAAASLRRYLEHSQPSAPAESNPSIPNPPNFYAEPPYIGSHQFLGRRAQLETLNDWATPANPYPVLLFEAIGGTGKSILTWHWINHHALNLRQDWAGRFWYSFYERGAVMADFCQCALAYMTGQPLADLRKKKTPELSERLLRELRARPWLLVLDGLERVLVSYHCYDAAQLPDEQAGTTDIIAQRDPCAAIRPEDDELLHQLAATAPSKLLITTRLTPKILLNTASQPIPGVLRERLSGLRPHDAEALFAACGIRGDGAAIQGYLQEHCDCHPLVTGVLAGLIHDYLPDRGNFDAWGQAPDGGGRLDLAELNLVQKRNHILLYSIETLPEQSRQLLSTLALLSESVDYATLSAFNPHVSSGSQAPLGNPNVGSSASRFNAMGNVAFETAFSSSSLETDTKTLQNSAQRLTATVKDLEKRGLLQYDWHTKRYDLHPVVRGVAFGKLNREETQIYGQTVVDYFSRHIRRSYQQTECLESISGEIQLIKTLLKMEHYQQAFSYYRGELSQALLFNLEEYHLTLSLLRPFFPNGWTSKPHKLNKTDAVNLEEDISGILNQIGSTKESLRISFLLLKNSLRSSELNIVCKALYEISMTFSSLGRLAVNDRCIKASLTLAKALPYETLIFRISFLLFEHFSIVGKWEEAKELWLLLEESMKWQEFTRSVYRSGYAEISYAWFQFYQGTLQEDHIKKAECLSEKGLNRLSIRSTLDLRGSWRLEQKEWKLAIESLQKSVQMARSIQLYEPAIETKLALAKFYSGQLSNPRQEAENLEKHTNVAHRPLSELWLAIGEGKRAVHHALKAYRWAWADGEPYVHRFKLNRAAALLKQLGEPIPNLPPYNPANDPPLPWEAEVEAAIAKLKAEKAKS